MPDIKRNFDKILPIANSFLDKMATKRHGRAPKFTDAEVITLSLVSESLGIDSENNLFNPLCYKACTRLIAQQVELI